MTKNPIAAPNNEAAELSQKYESIAMVTEMWVDWCMCATHCCRQRLVGWLVGWLAGANVPAGANTATKPIPQEKNFPAIICPAAASVCSGASLMSVDCPLHQRFSASDVFDSEEEDLFVAPDCSIVSYYLNLGSNTVQCYCT